MDTQNLKAPAYQFYPADWLSSGSVILMTPAEEGAYIRLLAYDWMGDGIVDDDTVLATLSRLGEGWLKGGSNNVRKCFIPHPEKPGFLTNPRLQKEREKQKQWKEKSREGGLKSAASRAKKGGKGGSTKRKPTPNRPVEPKGNSSSSSLDEVTPNPQGGDGAEDESEILLMIWSGHPQPARGRSSQRQLQAAWRKIPAKERPDHDAVLDSLALWRASAEWRKEDGQFAQGVHLWVKHRKWEVVPTPSAQPKPAGEDPLGKQRRSDEFPI